MYCKRVNGKRCRPRNSKEKCLEVSRNVQTNKTNAKENCCKFSPRQKCTRPLGEPGSWQTIGIKKTPHLSSWCHPAQARANTMNRGIYTTFIEILPQIRRLLQPLHFVLIIIILLMSVRTSEEFCACVHAIMCVIVCLSYYILHIATLYTKALILTLTQYEGIFLPVFYVWLQKHQINHYLVTFCLTK